MVNIFLTYNGFENYLGLAKVALNKENNKLLLFLIIQSIFCLAFFFYFRSLTSIFLWENISDGTLFLNTVLMKCIIYIKNDPFIKK